MNLSELKKKSPPDLLTMAADMGIENISRSRKQEVIFSILKSHARVAKIFLVMACLRYFKMDSDFLDQQIVHI